ncbi:two component transcriptional regulator, LuxR family [Pseudonocardia thermophila]|uniref:Two component transcriptional regulator, LuxR family n=1 Tax=Pseudonocardia thermophila TaxID=1848 RepID=A0A1M6WUK2_PSETH|nr:response regulator transcription factor [Pseudonocardia thermophila]SHK97336.1 two component transcriptional regulator, LuxR family [Pseudonocardia thermophila]
MAEPDRPRRSGGISILIADDHPIYRDGLTQALNGQHGLHVVAAVATGREALTQIHALHPDVAILDMRLPELAGLEVLAALEAEDCPTRTVVLSAYGDNATVYDAFSQGARAFLLKSSSAGEIAETVRTVARGGTVIPSAFQTGLVDEIRTRRKLADRPLLSARETQVLRLAADGRSAAQIASELCLSVATVKTHLQRIYDRLEVSDRASAVAAAMRRGLLA